MAFDGRRRECDNAVVPHDTTPAPSPRTPRRQSRLNRIGPSGQIALGKEFAGRTALVEEVETGVWMVRLGSFVPDNERWLWNADTQAALERAEQHAISNEPKATSLDDLERQLLRPTPPAKRRQ